MSPLVYRNQLLGLHGLAEENTLQIETIHGDMSPDMQAGMLRAHVIHAGIYVVIREFASMVDAVPLDRTYERGLLQMRLGRSM